MSNTTRQTSDVLPGAIGNGRRLKMGGVPCVPVSLLLASVLAVSVVAAGSWYTIAVLRTFFLSIQFGDVLANVVTVLLALLSIAVALPLLRAVRWSNRIRAAAARRDLVQARVAPLGGERSVLYHVGLRIGATGRDCCVAVPTHQP